VLDCSPVKRERELGLDRRETGTLVVFLHLLVGARGLVVLLLEVLLDAECLCSKRRSRSSPRFRNPSSFSEKH